MNEPRVTASGFSCKVHHRLAAHVPGLAEMAMAPVSVLRLVLMAAVAAAPVPGIACTGAALRPAPILVNGESMSSNSLADLAGEWVVTELMDATLPDGPPVTLRFEAGAVSGFSGCNTYTATVAMTGDKLALGSLGMTRMACGQEAMAVEIAFIRAMQRIDEAAIGADGMLSLSGFGMEMMRARRG
jgi:heat shock protein HslJ